MVSFTPYHIWGPDKGKKVCPICKYGRYNGVLYFVGRQPAWKDITNWIQFFESECDRRSEKLKVYFIYGNDNESEEEKKSRLEDLGRKLGLTRVALTIVPSFDDQVSDIYYNNINPDVRNTMLVYRHGNIINKFIGLSYSEENKELVEVVLEEGQGEFFHLRGVWE